MNPILSASLLLSLNRTLPLGYLYLIETINQHHLNNLFLITQDKNTLFFNNNPITINNQNSHFHKDDLIIIKGSWKSIKCLFKSNQLSPFGRQPIIIILDFSLRLDPVAHLHFLWNNYRFWNVLFLFQENYYSLDPFSGDIASLKADFAANARFVKMYETSRIELTTAIESDQLCVLVPAARRIPSWEAILTSLPGYDWAAIGCLYVVTSGFLILTSRIRHSSPSLLDIGTILFETSRPFLDGPLVRPPTGTPERLIIISLYVCYGLFLSTFRSQLFDQLQGQRTYPQIDTLQELWTSGLRIQVSYTNLADTFGTQGNDPLMENLLERIIVKSDQPKGNIAQLKRKNYYEQNLQENQNYHLISECPRTYAMAFAVHQGSFLQPSLDLFLLRALEFGIFNFWKQEEARIKNIKHFKSTLKPSIREFTLQDMTLAFWMFSMGILLATCVFILEFVIYRLKNYFFNVNLV